MVLKAMMVNLVKFADGRVTAEPGRASAWLQRRLPIFLFNNIVVILGIENF